MKLRFGKKIDLPSTASIRHELRLMEAIDSLVGGGILDGHALANDAERQTLAADVARRHGISVPCAGMLVDRLSGNGHTLAIAAEALRSHQGFVHGAPANAGAVL